MNYQAAFYCMWAIATLFALAWWHSFIQWARLSEPHKSMQISVLQASISQWHDETFGVSGNQEVGMINHTIEECDELKSDLCCYSLIVSGEYKEEYKAKALEEFADIFILMSALATKWDTNLESYILEKMIKNKKREWSAPDEYGMVHHTKEG